MNQRKQKNKLVDGHPVCLEVRLPPWAHICAFAIVAALILLSIFCSQCLAPTLGIAGALVAYYATFYARSAVIVSSHTSRVLVTIDFSRKLSEGLLFESRDRITSCFQRYLAQESNGNSLPERTQKAMQAVTNELLEQLRSKRLEPSQIPGQEERDISRCGETHLIDDAVMILDYFEDLAVGIEFGVFEEDVAKKLLKTPLMNFWKALSQVVSHFRMRQERNSIYVHAEELYNRWSAG